MTKHLAADTHNYARIIIIIEGYKYLCISQLQTYFLNKKISNVYIAYHTQRFSSKKSKQKITTKPKLLVY